MKHLIVIGVITVIVIIIVYYWNNDTLSEQYKEEEVTEKLIIGKLLNDKINLQYIDNFLSNEECDHIINLSKDKFTKSKVIDKIYDIEDKNRTSKSFYINRGLDNVIKNIEEKISKLVNKDINHVEGLQVVKYESGEYFNEHFDWFHEPYRSKINNQRLYTIFVYLNDADGETNFPKIGIKILPKKGNALFWQNCISQNNCFEETLHAGLAPKSGIKYGLNCWIRIKPITN